MNVRECQVNSEYESSTGYKMFRFVFTNRSQTRVQGVDSRVNRGVYDTIYDTILRVNYMGTKDLVKLCHTKRGGVPQRNTK
jgi:hypothetical protein